MLAINIQAERHGERTQADLTYPTQHVLFYRHAKYMDITITVALKFHSHKSVQKLFHNLHIIVSNSLMSFKVILRKDL